MSVFRSQPIGWSLWEEWTIPFLVLSPAHPKKNAKGIPSFTHLALLRRKGWLLSREERHSLHNGRAPAPGQEAFFPHSPKTSLHQYKAGQRRQSKWTRERKDLVGVSLWLLAKNFIETNQIRDYSLFWRVPPTRMLQVGHTCLKLKPLWPLTLALPTPFSRPQTWMMYLITLGTVYLHKSFY